MSCCVHCNCCGAFPSPTNTSFCVSNCGHIFCKECVDKGRLSVKCNVCGATVPKFVAIDRNMNPNLQVMFKKPGQLVSEHAEELAPIMKFQTAQRTLRFKMQQSQLKQEKEMRIELQGQVTTMRDQMKTLQRQYNNEGSSRSRNSSLESMRSAVSRGAAASNTSETSSFMHQHTMSETSSMHHHTMSSSVSSNETTAFLDPFKTPVSGLKRFTTSTPKQRMGGSSTKKPTEKMHSRHSSSVPSLSSFSMDVDDDDEIMDVTPAMLRDGSRRPPQMDTPQLLQMHQPPLPTTKSKNSSCGMMINCDPILNGVPPKTPLPQTPAPRKSMQSLSMAERLSAPRPPTRTKTPQKSQQQQPAVTTTPSIATPRPPTIHNHKTPCATPLLTAKLQPSPITPIRPINGSQLPSSIAFPMKHPTQANSTSAFKTPSLPPVKKSNVAPRTMPAGMKTSFFAPPITGISQQPHT